MASEKKRAQNDGGSANGGATPTFEEAIARLETIVEELEGGALSLEESIARYEEGIRLSKRLTQTLDEAEKRIERLVEADTEGAAPTTVPMEDDGRTAEAGARAVAAPARARQGAPGSASADDDFEGKLPF